MRAEFAMTEGPVGVGSAGGDDKATIAVPEELGPGAYGGAGGAGGREGPSHSNARHGADAPWREGKRALVESERMRHRKGHQRARACRGRKSEGPVRIWKEYDRVGGTHGPETAVEGMHWDTRRK